MPTSGDNAQPTVSRVVGYGDPSPIGGTFGRFTSLDVNDYGDVGFGACGVSYCSPSGIFVASGGAMTTAVQAGDPAPGGGLLTGGCYGDFFWPAVVRPFLSDQGDVGFFSYVNGRFEGIHCTGDRSGFYMASGGSVTKVAEGGDAAPGGGNLSSIGGGSMNNRGELGFSACTEEGFHCHEWGVFAARPDNVRRLATVVGGDPAPGGGIFSIDSTLGGVVLNDLGQAVFVSRVTVDEATQYRLFMVSSGEVSPIFTTGDPAPEGGLFRDFGQVMFNDLGDVLFFGTLTDLSDGIFLASGGGTTKIVKRGDPAPGGGSFVDYGSFSLNDLGQVAFAGAVDLGDGIKQWGVFLISDGSMTKVLGVNDPLPGGGNLRDCIWDVDLNNSGGLAFLSSDCVTGGYSDIYVVSGVGGPPTPPPSPSPTPTREPTPTASATPAATPAPLTYVAAGDSVPDGEDLGGCPIGTNCKDKAYPRYFGNLMAEAVAPDLVLDLRNVACSGFTSQQFRNEGSCRRIPYPNGSQLSEALEADGDLKVVTLTVGADNLLKLVRDPVNVGCLTGRSKNPAECEARFGAALEEVERDLDAALSLLDEKADLVIVTTYYPIYNLPKSKKAEIRRNVNQYMERLNSTIRSSAGRASLQHVFYLDLAATFSGHGLACRPTEVCVSQESWIGDRLDCAGIPDYRDFKNDHQFAFEIALAAAANDSHRLECLFVPGIHPTERGHHAIAAAIWASFAPIFEN